MRRFSLIDLQLLLMIFLWAANITAARYVLTHGVEPLAYASLRYLAAAILALGFVYLNERSLRVARRHLPLVVGLALLFSVNQLTFVSSIHLANASTVALIIGATPILTGIFAAAAGLGRQPAGFWVAAMLSVAGVVVITGFGGSVSATRTGDLLAVASQITWAAYSVLVAPLMRRYSPLRIFALVLTIGWVPIAATGAKQLSTQSWSLSPILWLLIAYSVVGPLLVANILWYSAIKKVGPARAALFANLEPFLAVILAVVLLSERLGANAIAGGALVFASVILERGGQRRQIQLLSGSRRDDFPSSDAGQPVAAGASEAAPDTDTG